MRAVNHDRLFLALLLQLRLRSLDALRIEVRAASATTQDDETMLVATRPHDGSQTLLRDTHEVVLRGGRAHSVNGNGQATIRPILKADREGQSGRQLAMKLRFRGARTDGAQGDQIGQELGGDGVEHLRGDGHAGAGEVAEELARDAQALVDLVRLVDVRVVDQALPAHGRAWLLQVGAHDDAEVAREAVGELAESVRVLHRGGRVVDGAGAADHEQAVVGAHYDGDGFVAALDDGLVGGGGHGNLGEEELGWDERVLAQD